MSTEDGKRYTDGMRISFPLQYVVVIVAAFLTVAGGMWTSTYGLRSDVRDILTRMELQAKLQDERANALREAVESMKRRQELQQYEIQGLKEAITAMQEGRKR